MESRRLVVWISAGILGFQGATLAFDLLNCTVLSWLFVRQHGMAVISPREREQRAPGEPRAGGQVVASVGRADASEAIEAAQPPADPSGPADLQPLRQERHQPGSAAPPSQPREQPPGLTPGSPAPPEALSAFDPTGVFCAQPRSRIDEAVSQGLTILAGLALGSSVGGGAGKGQP